jgi:hypothetical protein
MYTQRRTVVLAYMAGMAPLLISNSNFPAYAQSSALSSGQVEALVEDIGAHKQLCDKVTSSQTELFKECADQKTSLVARQQKLGVSDDSLNSKLKTRGWRWP